MILRSSFAALILLMAGCASNTPPIQQTMAQSERLPTSGYQIQIISEPPGARIEINSDYIGNAPIVVTVGGTPDPSGTPTLSGRSIDGLFAKNTVIRAIPSMDGQFTQSKIFAIDDQIPHRILFSMGLGPPAPQVNLNIQNDNSGAVPPPPSISN
jgi:hypothetical protein